MSNPKDTTGHREWDNSWVLWTTNGCPNDKSDIPIPGKHPTEDHPWNIDPVNYCHEKGIKYTKKGEKEKQESEEEY